MTHDTWWCMDHESSIYSDACCGWCNNVITLVPQSFFFYHEQNTSKWNEVFFSKYCVESVMMHRCVQWCNIFWDFEVMFTRFSHAKKIIITVFHFWNWKLPVFSQTKNLEVRFDGSRITYFHHKSKSSPCLVGVTTHPGV